MPPEFDGTASAVLSDADMVATAYTDGQLGRAAAEDRLSLIPVDGADIGKVSSTALSNSSSPNPRPSLFWRIVDDRDSNEPKLVSTEYSVNLLRGPHSNR